MENVEITLTSNSTSGIKPRRIAAQTVRITHDPDIVSTGVDGRKTIGRLPSVIRWLGGTARDLQGVTDVKIVDPHGAVIIEASLSSTVTVTREEDGCVIFGVLKSD
jgi:hypothetical protein